MKFALMLAPAMALLLAGGAGTALAQRPAANPPAVHLLGLEKQKGNAKGRLTVEAGRLQFAAGATTDDVPIASIQDVFTGRDSQRAIGGAAGTLTMLAPYGGGRFLSLFRKQVDTLTVAYRDEEGGLHGVIFLLPPGRAAEIKKQLVAQGARASLPVEEEQKQSPPGKAKQRTTKP